MKLRGPILLETFARADLNVPLREPAARLITIRDFTAHEYDLTVGETPVSANIHTLPRLMDVTHEILRSRPNVMTAHTTPSYSPEGPLQEHTHFLRRLRFLGSIP